MPLGVVSPGTQKRNFTHVDDIINGLLLVGEKGIGDDYGIGNDESYSILEIANLFGGEIIMLPERKGNRLSAEVMTEKTIKLGWKPQKSIKKYIKNLK
jgi:UDP-glucose 4-epimerase